MSLSVRQIGTLRAATIGIGLAITAVAAFRTWTQYRALSRTAGEAPPAPKDG